MLLCFIANSNNKNILILKEKTFVIFQKEYEYSQVIFARYYVCKWYNIPFIYFYKQQLGGLFEIKLDNSKQIKFKILYRDYLKLKEKIECIEEK